MLTSRLRLTVSCVLGFLLALTHTAHGDEGMWLPNRPPIELLQRRYGWAPSREWLEHVQRSCVRFSTGGSGSIVSPNGLVMTNHHVGAECIEKLSTAERDLIETGFMARTQAEELRCQDVELEVLMSIEDVTQRVKSAVTADMTPAQAHEARQREIAAITAEADRETGLSCEVVTLYQGGQYHLYCYKRYTDVRLVMAPEEAIAFFGGDNDNFEYPRYCLDVCFFRIYENGQPIRPEHYLRWSDNGAAAGDLAIVAGHPARTQRLFTLDHVKFLRDVDLPFVLDWLWRQEVKLHTFASRSDENARIAGGDIDGVQNSRKSYTGLLAGLHDPQLMQAKASREQELQQAVNANELYKQQWGDAWEQVALAQRNYAAFYDEYNLLEGRRAALRSDLFRMAKTIVRLADELPKPNAQRLREYRESELDSLYLSLYSTAPIYETLEIFRLESGLSRLAEELGGDHPAVRLALGGQSPRERAEAAVRGTSLKDIAERRRLVEGGKAAVEASKDPLIRLAAALDPASRELRKRYESEVESIERQAYDKLAAARFAIYGDDIYPDATFTLRLSFGPIAGYTENGQSIPPFTTVAGAFERMEQRPAQPPFALPQSWLNAKDKLDLSTPFNFVCTADIIGGNSGSPVLNTQGQIIGLIFDGNLHSLVSDVIYTEEQARAVSVDSRAIIEALRKVYDAHQLADEITGGE